ncbi:NAD-dependent epimerase/dehydratase family protein [[Clostridium] hylemonae]|uniref:NAD dependent epimerase/dehydratase family protein n=1 Tax=[Clostridium] hylemonae DSM 15053 TaxID=553973 RepID=C0C2E2_9FIRM|nr:NAD(P)-dependent oxidoreductase [[Clostridium] hylemonae]EEG73566.1 NAD dependent epimerase/dehydratase family protein [[Clostridium] hylemonae DSM 15053]QEK17168.1 GDP-6-deoxy-D-mannose reductase [[Clostridium] hylemonae DSM 15053]
MKKIVVTGATSFIGVHLIQKLLDENCYIYAVIRPNSANKERLPDNSLIEVVELDLNDIGRLPDIIHEVVDVFYHLAWEGVRAASRNDAELQQKNYTAAIEAVKSAVILKSNIFIGSGSQAEYGKISGKVDEESVCNPVTEYGRAKYKACLETGKIAKKNGMRFIWARIFSVYGEYDFPGTLVMDSLYKMSRNIAIDLTDCSQVWDFIYVVDVADVLVKFANVNCADGIYNIASGRPRVLKKFVEDMKSITKSESELNFGAIPYSVEGPVSLEPSVDKLKKELEWEISTAFTEGIKKMVFGEDTDEKNKYINTYV